MIRVLIVEDSMVEIELLIRILSEDKDIEIVGIASDGKSAIRSVSALKPDVITMDVHIPILDGIETTRYIMQTQPTPIIIVTNSYDPEENYKSFQALEAGALAILKKPVGIKHPNHKSEASTIIKYIKLMCDVKVVKRTKPISPKPYNMQGSSPDEIISKTRIIAIGASTGGPTVIGQILKEINKPIPIPIVIVQHMAQGFLENFITWLITSTGFNIKIATHGEIMMPNVVYFAPEDCHITVNRKGQILLTKDPLENGLRPSIARLFESVAKGYEKDAIGILLTGMGSDGALELKMMRDYGAITIVQDKESSVIHGMPGEAIKLGAAKYIMSPEQIIKLINNLKI